MSKIQVNEIVNHFDNGAPDCPKGLTVTGVSTFSGNVSVGGTLTYEDVTNIDSVGIITAQSGIQVTGGNVGINQISPTALLHTKSGANDGTVISTFEGATNNKLDIKFNSTGPALNVTAGDPLVFEISGTEKLRIDSGGRFFIGTSTGFNGGILCIGSGQGPNTPSGEHIKIGPNADRIEFLDTNSNVSDTGSISLWNTIYNNRSADIELFHPAGNTGGIKFSTHNGTSLIERMRINNVGNIGIGTLSPRCKLEVSDGTSNTAGEAVNEVYIVGATTGSSEGILTIQSNDAMAASKGGSIAFGGRAGTGGDTGANWAFINGYKENGTSGNYGGYLSFVTRPNSGTITERMRITSTGRVLVNTSITTNAQIVSTGTEAGNTASGLVLFDLGSDKKAFIARGFILGYGANNRKYSFEITGVTNVVVTTLHLTTLGGNVGGISFSTSGGTVSADTTVYNSRAYITMLEWADINYDA